MEFTHVKILLGGTFQENIACYVCEHGIDRSRSTAMWSDNQLGVFRKAANIVAVNIEINSQFTSCSVLGSWSTAGDTAGNFPRQSAGIWLHTETTPAPGRKETK